MWYTHFEQTFTDKGISYDQNRNFLSNTIEEIKAEPEKYAAWVQDFYVDSIDGGLRCRIKKYYHCLSVANTNKYERDFCCLEEIV